MAKAYNVVYFVHVLYVSAFAQILLPLADRAYQERDDWRTAT